MQDFNKSYDSLAHAAKEILEGSRDDLSEDSLSEDDLYEEAIDTILEDEDVSVTEMSDEEIEKILEDRFKTLSEKAKTGLLKKIGKGIASRATVSGRADRAAKKAAKGEKKIADREKLVKAKETLKKQKALRKAQKMAKRAGRPVPLSYADAGIKESESEIELDEAIPPLLVSILKTAAIGAGKALLKGLLDKAEKEKITPTAYDKFSSKPDSRAALNKLKSADPRYRTADRGGKNPFNKGTVAYELFNDL